MSERNADDDESSSTDLDGADDSASEHRLQRGVHDEFIKAILSSKEEAISVLRSAFPQRVNDRLDWSSLRYEPTEQVDAELAKRYNDLLFRVNLAGELPEGRQREVFIEVALEHQSSSDPMMPLRMLGLILRRTELLLRANPKLERVPIVLPVVLFQGQGKRMTPWRHPVRFSQLLDADELTIEAFRPYIPDFEFVLDDLTVQSRDALHERQLTAIAWIALTLLREASSNPELLQQLRNARDLDQWQRASETPNAAVVFREFWAYLYSVVDFPTEELHDFAKTVSELAERTQMTTAQRIIEEAAPKLRDEGRKEGLKEGLKEGETKGKAATLTQLVQFKFREVDEATLTRIANGSADELDLWTKRILFAASLDELFRD